MVTSSVMCTCVGVNNVQTFDGIFSNSVTVVLEASASNIWSGQAVMSIECHIMTIGSLWKVLYNM